MESYLRFEELTGGRAVKWEVKQRSHKRGSRLISSGRRTIFDRIETDRGVSLTVEHSETRHVPSARFARKTVQMFRAIRIFQAAGTRTV